MREDDPLLISRQVVPAVRSPYGTLPTNGNQENAQNHILTDVEVEESSVLTFPLIMAVLVATLLQFMLGYNTSVMNAPAAVVFPGHSTVEWSLAVAAFAIGGPFGALIGGPLADQLGRRGAILLCTWIYFFGGVIMSFAPNMLLLIPARLTVGFASGLASVVTPVYLGEIAPPNLRGTLGTMTQFSMVIGILASGLVGIPLATPSGWRYLFGITPLLCFLQIAVSPYLLESPRWLLSKDTQSHEARVVIKKFRGLRSDGDVETEAQHFLFALAKYKTTEASGGIGDTCSAIWELLRERRLRSLVLSALGLQVAQQLCGINAVFYYSTSFFQGVIDDPLVGTNLVAFVNVVATYIALRLMDSTGRRTLLLWSSGGMLVSTALILAALTGYVQQIYALAAVMAFVSFFEIGLGPVPWLIVAEMFDAKYVATAMSLACVVNWACNFLVGLLFPFMQEWLGPWSFGPFAAVIAITYALTLAYLPETRGLSTDEILGEVTSRQKKYGSRIVHVV